MDQKRLIQNVLHTLQVLDGSISESLLSQGSGSLLALSVSHGILTASQRVSHIGVGDENDEAWISQRNRGGLQGPESNHKRKYITDKCMLIYRMSTVFDMFFARTCQLLQRRERSSHHYGTIFHLTRCYLQSMSKA